jgi:hypothetical protein
VIANKRVPMATSRHTATEELLEAVFSVVRVTAIAMQPCGKHVCNNRRAVFSMWSVLRGYKRDEV